MRRLNFAILGLLLLAADPPGTALEELLPGEEKVPDRGATIAAGSRLSVMKPETYGCTTETNFTYFMKHLAAGDRVGMDRLLNGGGVIKVPEKTEVLVIENLRPKPRPPTPRSGLTSAQVLRSLQDAVLTQSVDKGDYPVEVRITSGALKDKVLFVSESSIAPLKTLGPPTVFTHHYAGKKADIYELFTRPAIASDTPDRAAKADAMLAAGQKHERKGEFRLAIGAYWFTMLDYKDLPQAETAARRLKAMGFYRTGSRDYDFDFRKKANPSPKK